jgi:ribosomal protein S18 acetylase RimI-like enzyme
VTTARIRRARIADLPGIAELERSAFGADAFSRRQLAYLLVRARACSFVACGGGAVVAFGIVLLPALPRPARIYTLLVAPSARGQGLARRLCLRMIDVARCAGYTRVRLEVHEDNTAAIALYESMGFSRIAALAAGYYADGAAGWRMQKPLAGRRAVERPPAADD